MGCTVVFCCCCHFFFIIFYEIIHVTKIDWHEKVMGCQSPQMYRTHCNKNKLSQTSLRKLALSMFYFNLSLNGLWIMFDLARYTIGQSNKDTIHLHTKGSFWNH